MVAPLPAAASVDGGRRNPADLEVQGARIFRNESRPWKKPSPVEYESAGDEVLLNVPYCKDVDVRSLMASVGDCCTNVIYERFSGRPSGRQRIERETFFSGSAAPLAALDSKRGVRESVTGALDLTDHECFSCGLVRTPCVVTAGSTEAIQLHSKGLCRRRDEAHRCSPVGEAISSPVFACLRAPGVCRGERSDPRAGRPEFHHSPGQPNRLKLLGEDI